MDALRESRERLTKLLRELFQFDLADLDFGIYRIMNFKRKEIERFIEEDLLETVEHKLLNLSRKSEAGLEEELKSLAGEINRDFGRGTIDKTGEVRKNRDAPKVQEYARKREELHSVAGARIGAEEIYNRIYEFFSRYFDEGDFLSTRRVGRREKYAVPYGGEDVKLHWANKDQYYVKTGEYFLNYSFKAGTWRVLFQVVRAEVEQENNVGERRYFILAGEPKPELDEQRSELRVFFHYRPLTQAEEMKYGTRLT